MSRARNLEHRLKEWGKEYPYRPASRRTVSGQLGASYGSSWLASIIKWHGRAPDSTNVEPINTAADEVQDAVRYLERQQSGEIPAEALRMEYCSDLPREECIRRLRLSSVRYSQHLRTAKIHVAGWLRLPFDERMNDLDQIEAPVA